MRALLVAGLFSVSLGLAGCAVPKQQKFSLTSTFDKEQAQKLMLEGKNSIKGSALMRQVNGGVVTCAGQVIQLIPATAYAQERMRYLYGNDTRGFRNAFVSQMNPDPFEYTDPAYAQITKMGTCDAQGFFKFEKLSDGEFFLISRITWKANPNSFSDEGGFMMRKVKLSGGEQVELVMAP
jgi:hypothetical protein